MVSVVYDDVDVVTELVFRPIWQVEGYQHIPGYEWFENRILHAAALLLQWY